MKKHKNAPMEQAQNLSKNFKTGIFCRKFENVLAATSGYYSESLKKLAGGEPPGENEAPNSSRES